MNFTKKIHPLISIITVSYNSQNTIERTIKSVLNQTYKNIEYIIIDGKSSDDTVKIAENYTELFEQKGYIYKIISEKDNGMYDALNKGIRLASGEVIGSINSDDWYELHAVETVVDSYRKTNFDMFYANVRLIMPRKEMIKKARLRKYITSRDWNHPTTFITKNIYNNYQYKIESMYDDFDLMLRLRKDKKKTVVLDKVLANFVFGGMSNKKSIAETIKRIKNRFIIYLKNCYSPFYIFECLLIEIAKYFSS